MFCGVFAEDKKLDSNLHVWRPERGTSVYISEKITPSVLLSRYDCKTNGLFHYQREQQSGLIFFPECTSSEYYVKSIME